MTFTINKKDLQKAFRGKEYDYEQNANEESTITQSELDMILLKMIVNLKDEKSSYEQLQTVA
ncbi:MAG: hypothetical protein R3Y35_15255 [Clostridia bacterium]